MFKLLKNGNGDEKSAPGLDAVVVLRDSAAVADAVAEALASASDAERPGLERAAALIAERAARPEREVRAEWVRGVCAEAGVDPVAQELHAIRAVRKAEPRLRLADAVQLVREARETAA
ncbi:hypothetical protein SMD11_2170 [Streptomyces albireticuli]|uniref:Uncharacterized protein n=1 Tax=Streptomyces albireticuli TaxID=1940 RepID=A0A1Z2L0I1_9ACTN|nr:hypothetical protein [Streptomyces albireticuli]ARZ67822.1 hypothetical protein SMD11_2170 [Streptomyces albireticuli]